MNYDLCDLLNRKMENLYSYFPTNLPNKSFFKQSDFIDKYIEQNYPEKYIEFLDNETKDSQPYGFWVYRNGLFSDQINDFESSARKVTRELANLSYSNNPALDIMYFSGVMKMIYVNNKCLYVETCVKPSLDQLMALKDFEKKLLPQNGLTVWRIVDRKVKNNYHKGEGLEKLFGFNWSRIK
jgi:hypothetical protein